MKRLLFIAILGLLNSVSNTFCMLSNAYFSMMVQPKIVNAKVIKYIVAQDGKYITCEGLLNDRPIVTTGQILVATVVQRPSGQEVVIYSDSIKGRIAVESRAPEHILGNQSLKKKLKNLLPHLPVVDSNLDEELKAYEIKSSYV